MTAVRVRLHANVGNQPVLVNFRYSNREPWAVALTIVSTPPVTWVVSRELLAAALACGVVGRDHGEGDVKIAVFGTQMRVWLRSPSGEAALWLHVAEVQEAVRSTYLVVPNLAEEKYMDWSGLDELLAPKEEQS